MNTVQENKQKVFEDNAKRFFDEEVCTILVSDLPMSDKVQGQVLIPWYETQNAVAYIQQQLAIQSFITLMVGEFNLNMSNIYIAVNKTALCITLTF